ncbi:hypothetical protein L1987_78392 [Smallanthus sonchifolius]|uniref:Uncharacterized protein n=1 Tax=Smallanthus sonchifolius TaxID=185202 RepID=A0ACB8ZH09_9ASTR|nr:hypothetical protein L1987_78392 [Smallanthus sonchifolius]
MMHNIMDKSVVVAATSYKSSIEMILERAPVPNSFRSRFIVLLQSLRNRNIYTTGLDWIGLDLKVTVWID